MPAQRLSRRTSPAVRRAATRPAGSARFLGPGGIALITVAAILTLRSLPSLAEYGWGSIFFYVVGAIFFFIPLAFVAAELATGWPLAGGMYAWVKQGFGPRAGFLAVWFDWIENVVWFPTVLSFVAATLAYMFDPSLASNRLYLVVIMLVVFWGLTLANFFGLKEILRFNNLAVVIGTLLPAAVLIGLGVYWLIAGRHNAIPFHAHSLLPNLGNINDVVFFAGVLLGYAGVEMAGYHAKETRNIRRDYPRAVFLSTGMIVVVSVLATLAIAFVVPQARLNLVSGLMQAFQEFFQQIGLGGWATKVMAALVGLGTLAVISTWMLGPSKGVYAAEESGDLPPELHYVNKRHAPVAMLIFQGILGTFFALIFLFMPSVSTSYWMLTALTTQLTVLMYLLMLAAAIRLRYTEPGTERPYRIPGGRYLGMWIVAGLGIIGSAFGLIIGFFPPTGISHWSSPVYIGAMVAGIVVCSLPPFLADIFKKPSWRITHPDPVLLDLPGIETPLPAGALPVAAARQNAARPATGETR
jgi:putative glutamate/gamma-aminobutyrate antiporter